MKLHELYEDKRTALVKALKDEKKRKVAKDAKQKIPPQPAGLDSASNSEYREPIQDLI